MAAATTSSPNTSPQRPNGLLLVTIRLGPFVAGRDELEEQVGGFGLERDVADLVDDQQRVAAEPERARPAAGRRGGRRRAGRPIRRRWRTATRCPAWQARIASPMARWVLPVPGGPRNTTLSRAATKSRVPRWAISLAFEAAGVVEVELLQALAGGEPGGADAALAAVGLPGGDLALQAGDQELLVGPGLGPGPLGQPRHRLPQRGCLQRPGQERDLGQVPRWSTARPSCRGGHHAHLAVEVAAERRCVVVEPSARRMLATRRTLTRVAGTGRRARERVGRHAWRRRGGGVGDGLVPGPDPFVVGDGPAVAEHPHPVQVGATSIRRPITAGWTE